jgi:hypothetical protein
MLVSPPPGYLACGIPGEWRIDTVFGQEESTEESCLATGAGGVSVSDSFICASVLCVLVRHVLG